VPDVLRIANCSGFYGDRLSAAREMTEGGPIDVLTGDYLAELTMALLWRSRTKDPDAGYARTFLTQMEEVLGMCLDRGIKVVANAGGLNPAGLARRLEELIASLGLEATVGRVDGDDIVADLPRLQADGHELRNVDTGESLVGRGVTPVTANAYLGGRGVAAALELGADVVVTGRITDAALVIGPAAWHFGWEWDQFDELAGALVAGHIIECGTQATGGNYSFFREISGLGHPGFPLVEMHRDGSFVVTKHPGTGGEVSVGTVTAQLLYEIGGPRYANPDVTARFDTIDLEQMGPDRVGVSGVRGEPGPASTKVALNYLGGFRNSVTFVLTGLDIEEKAALASDALWDAVGGRDRFSEAHVELVRTDRDDADTNSEASAHLRVTVKDPDPVKVGRRFSGAAVELALANYPGFHLTAPPGDATPYAVYWPTLVPASEVPHRVTVGTSAVVIPASPVPPYEEATVEPIVGDPPGGATRRVPLGLVAGARSGDKGGNANIGVWVRDDAAFRWLYHALSADRLAELLPELAGLQVERFVFPNLLSVNFVIHRLLGEGVSSSVRSDPQAKSLGEWLRSRHVDVPEVLLPIGGVL